MLPRYATPSGPYFLFAERPLEIDGCFSDYAGAYNSSADAAKVLREKDHTLRADLVLLVDGELRQCAYWKWQRMRWVFLTKWKNQPSSK